VIGIQGITTPEFEQIVSSTMNRLRKLTKHRIEIRYSHGMKKAGYLPKDFDIRKAGINTVIYFYPRKILARKMAPNFAGAELRRNPGQKKQILQRVENDINRLINISTYFANIKFAVKHQPKALKGTIKAALIGVPAGLSTGHLRVCLLEELTQVLGLPNDTKEDFPTSFKDRNRIWDLTKYDKMMLQALYDPRITPGMPKRDALAIARGIFLRLNGGQ
jgi:hypothetical protein